MSGVNIMIERMLPGKISNQIDKRVREARYVILNYGDNHRKRVIDLINVIKTEKQMLLRNNEAYQLFVIVKAINKIAGDIAEVGVYQGGSTKLICEAKKKEKALHLFDTFKGLPKVDECDHTAFSQGQYATSMEAVKRYLEKYQNVYLHEGIVPQSAESVKNSVFCFVHFDVDTYSSTRDCLHFFYPRLNQGGIILSHDFIFGDIQKGVSKAFLEFFDDKPETVIELAGSQCLVTKL
jgi:O-methyltransferase